MKNSNVNSNRIHEMDALRGFALWGVLLVNIFIFHAPYYYYDEFYGKFNGIEGLTIYTVIGMAGGKFMFIFSFLFGYGIQLQRTSRAYYFNKYFSKRMFILSLFGTLHILLFWLGDILLSYAILGLLVLPFLKLSRKYILQFSLLFIFFRPLYYLGASFFSWPLVNEIQPASLEKFISIFQEGTYLEIFQLRMLEFWAFIPENLVWYIPKSFGLFLLGIYMARRSFFNILRNKRRKAIFLAVTLLLIGTIWVYFKVDFFQKFDLEASPLWRPVLIGINVFFESLHGISYIIGFSILFQHKNWITDTFAKVGRLALSNYMLQSLICVILFYGYGLGLYAKLKPTELIGVAMLVYLTNLLFSQLYLKKWNIGPLEYLWKKWLN